MNDSTPISLKTQLRLLELPFSFLSELADEQRWVKFIVAVVHLRFSSFQESFQITNLATKETFQVTEDHLRSPKDKKINHSLNGTPMSKSGSVCGINCIHKLSLCIPFMMLKMYYVTNVTSQFSLTMTSCSAMITASSSSSSVPSSFNDLLSSLLN